MNEAWQIFAVVAALVAGWTGLIFVTIRSLLAKSCAAIEQKVGENLARIAEQDKRSQTIERQLLELKADLPLNYVRKEDFIRHEVVLNTKLDRLRDLMEGMKEDWRNKYGRAPKRSDD